MRDRLEERSRELNRQMEILLDRGVSGDELDRLSLEHSAIRLLMEIEDGEWSYVYTRSEGIRTTALKVACASERRNA